MNNFKLPFIWTVIVSLVAAVAYSFTTFATVKYVDTRHQDIKELILDTKKDVIETKQLLIELLKEKENGR